MATPTTRQEFKDYCLRTLGAPVIEINVDDAQVEDRIDQALQYFSDWTSNGSQRTYYKYQITSTDITNEYIDTNSIDSKLLTISRVFSAGINMATNNMFGIRYQMALNDFYGLRSGQMSMIGFVSTMQYIEMLELLLDPEKQIRFNKYTNRLKIDTNWSTLTAGHFLLIEGYTTISPETYSEAWNDPMLKKYATALIKKQWGSNLSKYDGIPLPGNITFNGQKLYEEASEEIVRIEGDILLHQEPPDFVVG